MWDVILATVSQSVILIYPNEPTYPTVAFSGDGESIQGRLLYSFTEAWLGTAGKIRGRRFQWIGLLLLSSLGQYIKAYMASA